MDKIRHFIKTPAGIFLALFCVISILFILIIKLMGSNNGLNEAKKMQVQNEPQASGNVRYTMQETLNTVSGEADNLTQNLAAVKKQLENVKAENIKEREENQKKFDQEIQALKKQNIALKQSIASAVSNIKVAAVNQNSKRGRNSSSDDAYKIGDGGNKSSSRVNDFVWVKDASTTPEIRTGLNGKHFNVSSNSVTISNTGSLLHPNSNSNIENDKENNSFFSNAKITRMYTIPQNTWLTGVIAEQPLIGIVPVNGEVINPRTLLFAVQAKNLAANNWHLPAVLKGIQGDAVCEGFFAIKRPAVTCNVTSLTFIFEDGRINTVNAKKNKKLGVITDLYGNPQISGKLHSNLGYFLAGTTVFSGLQGYGNALSAAQVQSQSGGGAVPSITTIIHNANTYAAGQGLSAAAQSAQQWWVDRMKSTFDYVEVPNWNPSTHQLLQLNVKITRSIALDYNQKDRKVIYAHDSRQSNNNSLD